MVDADLFAFGGGVTFMFFGGVYVVLRNRYQELVSNQALTEEALTEEAGTEKAETEEAAEKDRQLRVIGDSSSGTH